MSEYPIWFNRYCNKILEYEQKCKNIDIDAPITYNDDGQLRRAYSKSPKEHKESELVEGPAGSDLHPPTSPGTLRMLGYGDNGVDVDGLFSRKI